MRKNRSSNIFNLILVLGGAALFASAQTVQTGSAMAQGGDFMPKLLTILWLVLSILIFISGLRESQKEEDGDNVKGFLATLALLFAYIFLLKPIGFVIASILYTFAQMLLFAPPEKRNRKNRIVFAIVSIAVPIVVNLIFANVFSLILPEGTLFK